MVNLIRTEGPFVIEIDPTPLFTPTGDVGRFFEARLVDIKRRAKIYAPHGGDSGRTVKSKYNPEPFGYLRSSINGEMSRPGPLQIAFEVRADARYALFVIKGTRSPIRARATRVPAGETRILPDGRIARGGTFAPGTRGMYLPPNFGYKKGVPVQSVSGQQPNDFLSKSVEAIARIHPSLLGYDRTTFGR